MSIILFDDLPRHDALNHMTHPLPSIGLRSICQDGLNLLEQAAHRSTPTVVSVDKQTTERGRWVRDIADPS